MKKCAFPEFQMNSGCAECPIATCSGKQPADPKPLAQFLDEYLRREVVDVDHELLEQALEAYQSTENVTIKIERKYSG